MMRDDGKRDHPAANFGVHQHVGKERQREADEAVRSHLQQNARQDDRAGGRRFHVSVGQPGVEGEHRDFNGKGEEESEEQQRGDGGSVGRIGINFRRGFVESGEAEGIDAGQRMVMEIEEQDAQQHQHRASQGVEEKLDRGVKLARAAPDADQQVHRDQHGFPENEEEEEIERHEDAEHAGLQNQKPDVIFLDANSRWRSRKRGSRSSPAAW